MKNFLSPQHLSLLTLLYRHPFQLALKIYQTLPNHARIRAHTHTNTCIVAPEHSHTRTVTCTYTHTHSQSHAHTHAHPSVQQNASEGEKTKWKAIGHSLKQLKRTKNTTLGNMKEAYGRLCRDFIIIHCRLLAEFIINSEQVTTFWDMLLLYNSKRRMKAATVVSVYWVDKLDNQGHCNEEDKCDLGSQICRNKETTKSSPWAGCKTLKSSNMLNDFLDWVIYWKLLHLQWVWAQHTSCLLRAHLDLWFCSKLVVNCRLDIE